MTEQKYKQALEAFEKAIKIKPKYYAKAQENRKAVKVAISRPSEGFWNRKDQACIPIDNQGKNKGNFL